MKKATIFLVLIIVLESCSDKPDITPECNSRNPMEMKWMKNWVSELQFCTCTISIFQAEFNGESVFWSLMNDPLCQSVITNIPVFNCRGNEILILNNYQNWVDFNEDVTDIKIIYVCSNN